MSIRKGQNLRLFLGQTEGNELAVACATSCTLHLSAETEETTTKDSTGDWKEQDATSKGWDLSSDSLVNVDSTDATGIQTFDLTELIGRKVFIKWQETEGDKNRVAKSGGVCYSGQAIVSDVSITAANKQNGTASIQLQGTGKLEKTTIASV